jgi:hypothetical protein
VDGLASPLHRPMAHSRLPRGHGLPVRCCLVLSRWWLVMFIEEGKFPKALLLSRGFVLSSNCLWNSHSKMGSYQAVLTL